MRRPRPRIFWAWTLTLTAALLAVVWVGGMKASARVVFDAKCRVDIWGGGVTLWIADSPWIRVKPRFECWAMPEWINRWWVRHSVHSGTTVLYIPLWPFVLLTGVPGVWMMVKTRQHTNPNACPACGYDKAGLPQPQPAPPCAQKVARSAGRGDNVTQ